MTMIRNSKARRLGLCWTTSPRHSGVRMSSRPAARRPLIALLAGLLIFTLGALPAVAQPAPSADTLPLEEIQTFSEIFERIKRAYVEEVDDSTLIRNAMRGMLSELDPHSAYLDRDEFQSLRESTEGEFGGIGIEVGLEDGRLTVITPIDETPASRAGLQARDIILEIDDEPTDRLSLQESVTLMRGEPGSEIHLLILRSGEDEPLEFILVRESICTESVRSEMLESGYGYLRVSQFQSRTGEQVNNAIQRMERDGALQGLVLDLRNNPGGILQAAVAVADAFLEEGLVVYTEGRLEDTQMRFSANSATAAPRSEEHTSELQSRPHLVCRLLLEKKK